MTAKFSVISKKNPRDPNAPERYYPSYKSSGRTDTRELVRRIGEISTVSSVDSLAVVEGLLAVIPQELAKGNIVELGDFGSFRITIQSNGEDRPEDVNADNIEGAKATFMPGKLFQQVLDRIEFKKE